MPVRLDGWEADLASGAEQSQHFLYLLLRGGGRARKAEAYVAWTWLPLAMDRLTPWKMMLPLHRQTCQN
jgi:hypothetical protein